MVTLFTFVTFAWRPETLPVPGLQAVHLRVSSLPVLSLQAVCLSVSELHVLCLLTPNLFRPQWRVLELPMFRFRPFVWGLLPELCLAFRLSAWSPLYGLSSCFSVWARIRLATWFGLTYWFWPMRMDWVASDKQFLAALPLVHVCIWAQIQSPVFTVSDTLYNWKCWFYLNEWMNECLV